MTKLIPKASVVEREVQDPGKAGCQGLCPNTCERSCFMTVNCTLRPCVTQTFRPRLPGRGVFHFD